MLECLFAVVGFSIEVNQYCRYPQCDWTRRSGFLVDEILVRSRI